MVRKLWMLFSLILFFSGIFVYWQTGWEQQTAEPSLQIQAFNGLWAMHCDEWLESDKLSIKSSLTLDASETKTLCNVFINESNFPITVKYSYVNAELWDAGTPNCDIAAWKFGLLISTPEPTTFTIPANSNIVRNDKMFLPAGMSGGVMHWCLWFGIVSVEPKPGESLPMFKIENRKVILYDVLIGGKSSILNAVSLETQKSDIYITNTKIKWSYSQWWLALSVTIKNSWNIDQIITWSGKISNFLWFQKEFSFWEIKVGPYQSTELVANIWNLPTYKGLFSINMDISHTTSFDFDISAIPAELLKWGVFNETWQLFIFSRYAVGAIVIVLLFLRLIIKSILPKRQKSIQQPI